MGDTQRGAGEAADKRVTGEIPPMVIADVVIEAKDHFAATAAVCAFVSMQHLRANRLMQAVSVGADGDRVATLLETVVGKTVAGQLITLHYQEIHDWAKRMLLEAEQESAVLEAERILGAS